MKKNFKLVSFILLASVLILTLSACSKKTETKNKEPEVKKQEIDIPETQAQEVQVPESQVSEAEPQKQNVSVDGPVISNLKPGDKVGNYVIKEINGILCQSNCKTDQDFSGSISFEGEHIVTGKFLYSPEYPIRISFVTNIESKIPELGSNFDKDIVELLIENPSISLMNEDLNNDDYSLISRDIPAFIEFAKGIASSSEDLNRASIFGQEVTIKIKNYKTSVLSGGEAGPTAELVEIVETAK